MRGVKVVCVSGVACAYRSLLDAFPGSYFFEECENAIGKSIKAKITATAQGLAHVGENPG